MALIQVFSSELFPSVWKHLQANASKLSYFYFVFIFQIYISNKQNI